MSWRCPTLLGMAVLFLGAQCATALAIDPRNSGYEFKYTLYPPEGFSVKKPKAIPRPDPKEPKAFPIVGKDGKFTPLGQWYYAIGSDPRNFQAWWYGYFTDTRNWTPTKTPVFVGTGAGNQGHRIIAWLGNLKRMVDQDAEIDAEVKKALCSEEWKRAAEQRQKIRDLCRSEGPAFGKIDNAPERSVAQVEAYKTVYQQILTAKQRRRVDSR